MTTSFTASPDEKPHRGLELTLFTLSKYRVWGLASRGNTPDMRDEFVESVQSVSGRKKKQTSNIYIYGGADDKVPLKKPYKNPVHPRNNTS